MSTDEKMDGVLKRIKERRAMLKDPQYIYSSAAYPPLACDCALPDAVSKYGAREHRPATANRAVPDLIAAVAATMPAGNDEAVLLVVPVNLEAAAKIRLALQCTRSQLFCGRASIVGRILKWQAMEAHKGKDKLLSLEDK